MIRQLREQLSVAQTESVQQLSAYDNHPADLGTETFDRELEQGLERDLSYQLRDVMRAVEKVDEGTYGICENCHRPISPARLRARPEALFCLPCQEEQERQYHVDQHSVVSGDLDAGDQGDNGEIDGQNIWQRVVQWDISENPEPMPPAVDYHETSGEFIEPLDFVEPVELVMDKHPKLSVDPDRKKVKHQTRRTDKESDEYPL